jgi:hypothetical protein
MGERRCVYRVLVGKSEEKTSFGRPRCRREDNIKMDVGAWSGFVWLRIGRTLVNTVVSLRVP